MQEAVLGFFFTRPLCTVLLSCAPLHKAVLETRLVRSDVSVRWRWRYKHRDIKKIV
jgi:hypothetical protein